MVGCGLISNAHGLAAVKSQYDVRFVACMSRTMESAQAWAGEYGCDRAYDELGKMLAKEELDGIVIASWPSLHYEQIIACIEAGVPAILCEKALVINAAEALGVWNAAREAGATVVEGFMYRHHPAFQRLEELLCTDKNGQLDSIHAVFNMLDETPESSSPGWRRRTDAGGGVAHDFLCYPVDAACHLAGAHPVSALATGSSGPHGAIDHLTGVLEFANGVVATLESSRRANLNQRLEVRGANVTLALPFAWTPPGDAQIEIMRTTGFLDQETQSETITPGASHDGRLVDFPVFTRQMDNFVEVARSESEPLVSLEGSVINACVIDALLASLKSGSHEAINLPPSIRSTPH